jgi:CheY-like chemotaxis protein
MRTPTEFGTSDGLGCMLVIDDEPDVIGVISTYFEGLGYDVVTALHGADGLMLAEIRRPDIVLLDIMMPGMTGVEVLQQLRLQWPELPVIMLTAVVDSEIAKSTLRRGAFDYVPKPFEWEHLDRVVTAAMILKTVS